LKNAADYIMKLPKAEQKHDKWQTAVKMLIMAAEGRGPLMHARIGVLQALHRNVERVFKAGEKKTHWGKRKLARDRWPPPSPARCLIEEEYSADLAASDQHGRRFRLCFP
jgi:hypothetical protein